MKVKDAMSKAPVFCGPETNLGAADMNVCPSVPSMGRILLDERSQPEPMTATVVKRKA